MTFVRPTEYQDWWGVFAPANTPRAIIDKLGKETARILQPPDLTKQLSSQGAEAAPSSPDEFIRFVRMKIDAARFMASRAGIRTD